MAAHTPWDSPTEAVSIGTAEVAMPRPTPNSSSERQGAMPFVPEVAAVGLAPQYASRSQGQSLGALPQTHPSVATEASPSTLQLSWLLSCACRTCALWRPRTKAVGGSIGPPAGF